MRPDYSLIIRSASEDVDGFEPVMLHFDAKYRVAFVKELFGDSDELADGDGDELPRSTVKRGSALRADLLKLHAYRDAIHRSSGAYVLYPGDDEQWNQKPFTEYHELLPGLGAFVLRPTQDGIAIGTGALRVFLDDVLDHVATRLTEHERARYWSAEVYGLSGRPAAAVSEVVASEPAADASILLGYAKSLEHWNWITERRTYNVRTEGRPGGVSASAGLLYSQLLVLYCPTAGTIRVGRIVSGPELISKLAIKNTGYPDPRGDYLCVQVYWIRAPWISGVTAERIDEYVRGLGLGGVPTTIRWGQLARMR
jgi:hypothetical protein